MGMKGEGNWGGEGSVQLSELPRAGAGPQTSVSLSLCGLSPVHAAWTQVPLQPGGPAQPMLWCWSLCVPPAPIRAQTEPASPSWAEQVPRGQDFPRQQGKSWAQSLCPRSLRNKSPKWQILGLCGASKALAWLAEVSGLPVGCPSRL